MPMPASHPEPTGPESHAPGSAARNNGAQTCMSNGFITRMPFLDARSTTHAAETCAHDEPLSLTASSIPAASNNGLAARMRLLIRSEGSMAAIARRCGFSEGAVRSWRDGQSDISRERCIVMARTLNVSLIWLITGEGPMRPDAAIDKSTSQPSSGQPVPSAIHAVRHQENNSAQSVRPAVDSRVLAAALRLLQSYVGLLGGSLSPMQRADVLAELYDILSSADEPDHIDRLIAFHSMLSGQMRHSGALVA